MICALRRQLNLKGKKKRLTSMHAHPGEEGRGLVVALMGHSCGGGRGDRVVSGVMMVVVAGMGGGGGSHTHRETAACFARSGRTG